MPVAFTEWITRGDVQSNLGKYFVFGDNEKRVGTGGQAAAMRGEPNAIGVRTKKAPTMKPEDFWSDTDKERCTKIIDEDFAVIEDKLKQGLTVIFPGRGLGTGLSRLPELAPELHDYIRAKIAKLVTDYGLIEGWNDSEE